MLTKHVPKGKVRVLPLVCTAQAICSTMAGNREAAQHEQKVGCATHPTKHTNE
jgi:hypothetical protein